MDLSGSVRHRLTHLYTAQFRGIWRERDQIFLRNHIVFVLLSFHYELNFWTLYNSWNESEIN